MARLTTKCGTEFTVSEDFVLKFGHLKFYLLNNKYVATTNWKPRLKKSVTELVHRLAMGDIPEGMVVDHIDCDKLNNDTSNLRVVSQSQNCYRSRRKSNTSGFRGVSWNKRTKKWKASIERVGKQYHIGLYDDLQEAAKAYDAKALELFGEFANLNFKE